VVVLQLPLVVPAHRQLGTQYPNLRAKAKTVRFLAILPRVRLAAALARIALDAPLPHVVLTRTHIDGAGLLTRLFIGAFRLHAKRQIFRFVHLVFLELFKKTFVRQIHWVRVLPVVARYLR
jgi:hypothetical protein